MIFQKGAVNQYKMEDKCAGGSKKEKKHEKEIKTLTGAGEFLRMRSRLKML